MLSSLEYWMMNRVQKLNNPKCYAPSSEPFRIDSYFLLDRVSSVDILALNKHMNQQSFVRYLEDKEKTGCCK
jgi:hypothetical protein